MPTAPRPDNEQVRLATLRECHILDTPPEPTFDELARLATLVCDAPIGVVTLVDAERQWFKSRLNLDLAETSRDVAFCAFAILTDDLLIVPDATQDERFRESPLVTGRSRIRFYAGAPLVMRDRSRIGTLAVMDAQPRLLKPSQVEALASLAHQVVAQLELRRHLHEENRLQTERFRMLAQATNDAVWDWDLIANKIWWSEGLTTLFGLPPSDIASIEARLACIHPDDRSDVEHSVYGAIAGGRQTWSAEYRIRRHDGGYADVLDRGHVIYSDRKPIRMIGAMLDLTERRRLELELRQSQKMDALGQLSGGIAHDFNNLLTVIQANATLLKRATGERAVDEHADEIGQAAARAAALTRQLLLLSRKQVMQRRVVHINDVVRNITRMLQRALGPAIDLIERYATRLPPVKADIGMLEQVLLNLAVNAKDAMPSGGRLLVETGDCVIAPPQERDATLHVFVRVTDTGAGIHSDLVPHIFEPFFTTKDIGKGSGLGLATVYGIIRQHKGWIDVTSELGHGTTFCFYLPATTDAIERATPGEASMLMPTGTETVLVVEDDEPLRRVVVHMLETCGYTVIAAHSGVHALEQWPTIKHRVQLLFTDIVMPGGVTGCDLVERIRRDAPALPVVYTSGYAADHGASGDELVEDENFLAKPHTAEKLAQIVRASIDRGAKGPR